MTGLNFKDQPGWDTNQKTYAQMVTNLDTGVGRIMATLDRLDLTENTLVIFSSDNGPRSEPAEFQTKTVDFFDSNCDLQGYKRDVYEGGIRVPMIAHWPGHVPKGKTSEAKDVAQDHPEIVMQIETYLKTARVETPNWPDSIFIKEIERRKKQKLRDRE